MVKTFCIDDDIHADLVELKHGKDTLQSVLRRVIEFWNEKHIRITEVPKEE